MADTDGGAMLPVPVRPGVDESQLSDRQDVSPLRRVHHLLQGRYAWVVGLSLIFGALGGAGGYFFLDDIYLAKAHIEAESYREKTVYQLEENERLPDFDRWVARRARLITEDPRVLQRAFEDPSVQRHVLTADQVTEGAESLRDSMTVFHDPRTSMITVMYEHTDPEGAEIVTQAVIEGFMAIYGQRDIDAMNQKIVKVTQEREERQRQIKQKKQEISLIANEYGSDVLLSMYERKLADYQEFESKTRLTETEMVMRGIDVTLSMDEQIALLNAQSDQDPNKLTAQDYAIRGEPTVRKLMSQMDAVAGQIRSLNAQGLGSQHWRVKNLKGEYDSLASTLQREVDQLNALLATQEQSVQVAMVSTEDLSLLSDYQLIRRYATEEKLRKELEEQTRVLGQRRLQIDELKEEVQALQQDLAFVEGRLKRLTTEAGTDEDAGRLDIASNAFALRQPVNGGKRKQLAVAGMGAGVVLGVGVMLLIGLMDPRVRSTDEATSRVGQTRLLGVLPMLPEDLGDPANAAVVGYSVHHMRTLLQLGHRAATSPAFAVTGPATGSGKTSLTISLGMSFAATGARTLLIDSDLAGGGLSYRLEAVVRRRIGQILVDAGEITSQELQQALAAASSSGQRLGESLINLGLLEPSRLSEILEMQTNTYVGLLDAINGEPVEGCITQTDIENLWVLPIGGALLDDMGRISPNSVRNVIQQAREQFDVVLVDTGPIPGSVETSMVAAEADQVVMIVARGDERSRVESAVGFLHSLGANLAGFVFNRAEQADLERSHLSSSLSSRSAAFSTDQRQGGMPNDANGPNFGAVARAMVSRHGEAVVTSTIADVEPNGTGARGERGG
ncbi:nucleotide-binding protein [Mucisphaera calidilacus]|uniref:Tyrosine-protein kinase CpsD n=1 Tax=Mucisphaera calidilacus TaxID=2527982 RepID=A0A518BVG2_9BACT|nr:AAA family ATPase [Mucisphaera calidilacus]QDU70973.1 Tyrosine-protein kinase CpsD [Mucisphaera calidilacus]